jgi:OmcA/MtrC family decaheme c-type cytochrome
VYKIDFEIKSASIAGAGNGFGCGWSVSVKYLVHGIHACAKRAQPFTYEATAANPNGFQEVTYPGVLKVCQQCHVAASYGFSAAIPNLLWTTEAKTDMRNPTNLTPIGQAPWIAMLGLGQVDYSANNLVTWPMTSSCFGCHDSHAAITHMQGNNGTIYGLASTVTLGGGRTKGFTMVEACAVCHAPGKVADIAVMHAK